uniref:Uncharacterized protein n=1 Tax=Panagrolaimus superbus TaxID=310955 RepID=A0A914ZC61_9BILA
MNCVRDNDGRIELGNKDAVGRKIIERDDYGEAMRSAYMNDDNIYKFYDDNISMDIQVVAKVMDDVYEYKADDTFRIHVPKVDACNISVIYPSFDKLRGSCRIDREDIIIGMVNIGDGTPTEEEEQQTQEDDVQSHDADNLIQPEEVRCPRLSIDEQAHNTVMAAAEVYQQLIHAVDTANNMLVAMKKPNQKIREDLLAKVQLYLTDSPD